MRKLARVPRLAFRPDRRLSAVGRRFEFAQVLPFELSRSETMLPADHFVGLENDPFRRRDEDPFAGLSHHVPETPRMSQALPLEIQLELTSDVSCGKSGDGQQREHTEPDPRGCLVERRQRLLGVDLRNHHPVAIREAYRPGHRDDRDSPVVFPREKPISPQDRPGRRKPRVDAERYPQPQGSVRAMSQFVQENDVFPFPSNKKCLGRRTRPLPALDQREKEPARIDLKNKKTEQVRFRLFPFHDGRDHREMRQPVVGAEVEGGE